MPNDKETDMVFTLRLAQVTRTGARERDILEFADDVALVSCMIIALKKHSIC